MNNNIIEQVIKGFEYARNAANTIETTGVGNMQKLIAIYTNIDIFLQAVNSGQISLIDNTAKNDDDNKNE